ncbi:MAG: beta-lactamase hydrolase domain-containing protein, partial [Gemmobacter sp.]
PAAPRRGAAAAAGLAFVFNPVVGGMLTEDNVTAQGAAIAAAEGPVLAYCASGNRSSIVWALAQAGTRPVDELIGLPGRHGYQLEGLRPMIEARAARHG